MPQGGGNQQNPQQPWNGPQRGNNWNPQGGQWNPQFPQGGRQWNPPFVPGGRQWNPPFVPGGRQWNPPFVPGGQPPVVVVPVPGGRPPVILPPEYGRELNIYRCRFPNRDRAGSVCYFTAAYANQLGSIPECMEFEAGPFLFMREVDEYLQTKYGITRGQYFEC